MICHVLKYSSVPNLKIFDNYPKQSHDIVLILFGLNLLHSFYWVQIGIKPFKKLANLWFLGSKA